MRKHFIKNIAIKKFKCFEDFSANGFQRVNLITGKNNVGKTTFMEACFLMSNIYKIYKYDKSTKTPIDREALYFEITKLFIILQSNREKQFFLIKWMKEETKFNINGLLDITMNEAIKLESDGSFIFPSRLQKVEFWNDGGFDIDAFRNDKFYNTIYTKNNPPLIANNNFVYSCNDNYNLNDLIGDLKINNKFEKVKNLLNKLFDIKDIDVIKNKIMLKTKNSNFINLSEFGDGVKNFISIIVTLLSNNKSVIYLDEVENGIHYSKLDELWEVILKTSKELNVQIFATTHSKECIDSYARVAKKLRDEEVTLINLVKVKSGEIKAGVYNFEVLKSAVLDQNHEVR
jgi:AAA15 family ATPase/GTPase